MSGFRIECAEIELPEFGLPREQVVIPAATYEGLFTVPIAELDSILTDKTSE